MLFSGNNLLDSNTPLQPVTLEAIFLRIQNDEALREDISRLRRVRQLDQAAYSRLKIKLPYLCAAQCRDGIRRGEQFEQISWMTLDVDHYSGSAEALQMLKERLRQDERVALLFISPGGDGLKLLFRLQEPCTDTKRYSDAYKSFAFSFGEQYELGKYLDFRTSDATRVCFLSHDPQAYLNPLAECISWAQYLPEQTQSALALVVSPEVAIDQPEKPGSSHQIHPDTYADILASLKNKARPNPMKREVYVPEALDLVMPLLQKSLEAQGIAIAGANDINFGRQLSLRHGSFSAEINLFYGKKGFSVVQVPKRNTHEKLAELAALIIEQAIYSREDWSHGQALSDGSDASSPVPAKEVDPNHLRYA